MRIEEKEYTKSIDISIWKKVFPFLAPRKNVLIMVIVMNILCSVVDIIMPLFQRQAIDSFIEKNTLAGLGGFIALYIAVAQWNSYFNALVYIRSENLKPLQLVVRNILITNQSLVGAGDGLAAQEAMRLANLMKYAVIIITTVPIMCVYPFVQKYFSQGVMIGAIKG